MQHECTLSNEIRFNNTVSLLNQIQLSSLKFIVNICWVGVAEMDVCMLYRLIITFKYRNVKP